MTETTQRLGEFSQLAQDLAEAPDEEARSKLAVDSAVALVARCDHAGITINERRGLITQVSSDEVVRRANELQQELGEGPCLDVMRDQDTLVIANLTDERRWPRWAAHVHDELGVASMMSLFIYTDQHAYGALSLYAGRGQRFDVDDVAVGQAIAGLLAVTMTSGRHIDQLSLAMHNRITIGRAEGILMERLGINENQAFDYLRRTSMHINRKVIDIANDIAQTRELPSLD